MTRASWRFHGFNGERRSRSGQAAKMPPVCSQACQPFRRYAPSRNRRPELRRGGIAAIRNADRAANAEPASVKFSHCECCGQCRHRPPLDKVRVHPALHDEILDEMPTHCPQRGADAVCSRNIAQPARGVVFASALPRSEMPRCADTSSPGSRRNMTSREIWSYLQCSFDLIVRP